MNTFLFSPSIKKGLAIPAPTGIQALIFRNIQKLPYSSFYISFESGMKI